jgi:hypothetical protein
MSDLKVKSMSGLKVKNTAMPMYHMLFSQKMIAVVLIMLMCMASAQATVMQPLSMPELKAKASHILLIEIKSCESQWEQRRIATTCVFDVMQRYQGDSLANEKQKLKFLGGAVAGIAQKISGAPELKPAMQVLAFLQCESTSPCQIVGFAQGIFYPVEIGQERLSHLSANLSAIKFMPKLNGIEFHANQSFDQQVFEKAKTIEEILNLPSK